jgi:hypothetical protein
LKSRWDADCGGETPTCLQYWDLGEEPQDEEERDELETVVFRTRAEMLKQLKPAVSLAAEQEAQELALKEDARVAFLVTGKKDSLIEPSLDEIASALKWVTSRNKDWKFDKKPVHLVVYVAKPAAPPSGSSSAHFGLPEEAVFRSTLSLMEKMTLGTDSLAIVVAPTVVPPH